MRLDLKIESILSGESPSQYLYAPGQYLQAIGVDPDLPISDSVGDRSTSGAIRFSAYAAFDGANVNATPVAIVTNPKNALVYVGLSNGRLISYDSSFGSETLIGTITGSAINGMWYQDNYIYMAGTTDISRYGPLDGTPTIANTFWTTTLSLTALVNTAYPAMRGGTTLPNHWGFFHINGRGYFLDFDSTSTTALRRGRGLVHYIQTKYGSAQGDTNDNSTYNALDLPADFMPTCACSYGNDIVIGAIQTTNTTLNQGNAFLFFWDTLKASFYNAVRLPDPLVTALLNNNGQIYAWTGPQSNGSDSSNGYRLSAYLGGQTLKQLFYSNAGQPPLAGAVDAIGDRVIWGTFEQVRTTTAASPDYYAVVKALGSKDGRLPSGVHTIARATAAGTAADGVVTCLKAIQHSSFAYPKVVIGHRAASSAFGLDSQTTTYGTGVFRSQVFQLGRKFSIRKIRFTLGAAVAANHTITPKVFLDDFSSSSTTGLTVINNTNYAGSERFITYYPDISGDHNFCLEFVTSGTALLPILLPVEITVDVNDD